MGDGCASGACSSGNCSSGTCSDADALPPGMLEAYDVNQDASTGILVWAEARDGALDPSVPGLLSAARRLSDGRVYAALAGGPGLRGLYGTLFSYGADTVYHIRGAAFGAYRPEACAEAVADLAERIRPASILFPATPAGREVAPLTAGMLGAGLTTDCTGLAADGRRLLMTRPAFGGDVLATVECRTFPQMATVRPGAFEAAEPDPGRKGTAIARPFAPKRRSLEILSESGGGGGGIGGADVLLALGNGIKDRGTVDMALELAEAVGAEVVCTRPLAERGWLPRSRQVGLSGRSVSPKLYVAFGVSGSPQHMAGVRAGRIVAVCSDPDAPIARIADETVVGDASEIIEKMLAAVRSRP